MNATDEQVEALTLWINNDKHAYDAVVFAVKRLRRVLDDAASQVAKERAEWHDDPAADDYAAFHAPADVQFPREARDQTIRELVAYYLNELKLQE